MDVVVKRAQISDVQELAQAHFNSVHGTGAKFYSKEICQEWSPATSLERTKMFTKALSSGLEIMFVARIGGKVAGFASIVPNESELYAVYVDPKFGRQGVGKLLLKKVEEEARNQGVKKLEMHASLSAEAFYKSQGYVEVERIQHVWRSGTKMPAIKMEKALDKPFEPVRRLCGHLLGLRA